MATTTVYTDGACLGNPGPGGWAWAVPNGRWEAGPSPLTTNQRMEIQAVLSAVTTLEGPLEVVSDSTYVVNCFRDRWWEGWLARGWVNSAKKPVANRDLWEPLLDAYRSDPRRLTFTWVKGHSDDVMNDVVDRLAVEAARTQQPAHGDRLPDELPDADAPSAGGAAADPRVPQGRKVVVVGHKPLDLGGWDPDNDIAATIRARLAEILEAKQSMHPDLVVLTGLGLGTEQLAAEAAAAVGVPYVAVLPYPDPQSVWPAASQRRYETLLANAKGVVLLQAKQPETKQSAGGALARRDGWLARHADEAIAVWNRQDPLVGKTVRTLIDRVGDEDVWIVEPVEPLDL